MRLFLFILEGNGQQAGDAFASVSETKVLVPDRSREYSWEFLADVCRLVPKILTLFQTKKCYFSTRSQTWPLKSIPVFRPGLWANFLSSLLRLDGKPKKSSNAIRSRIFLFRSYSFGIDTINTFILSLVPLKTIRDSRAKQRKCVPIFIPKRPKTPPGEAACTYLYGLYKEESTPPLPRPKIFSSQEILSSLLM